MNRMSVLKQALQEAGREILKFDPATVVTKTKTSAGDLVTAADVASQRCIIDIIHRHFPDDTVISEEIESGQELLNESNLGQLTCWVIDPIDGTNNFKRAMAYSGISIGYIEKGKITLGGILDPYRNFLYCAEKGAGATCNDRPITVAGRESFDAGTRVCTSNSYEGGTAENLHRYERLGYVWVDVLGSAVLIMADIAAGRLDLYHHNGLKPWDNAAGFLIAEEAGAKITGLQGQAITWLSAEAVMGNAKLVDEFIARTNTGPQPGELEQHK